ncbi:unnamed protein product [Periconia digitata]|uniref:Uncharacterized protein n=1 Tax=Periconia digitata TaxID=1303443 RepID=A0A9W4XHC5_9PLEO|nr:unnamed protein product [Periconia digitata]
MESLIDTFVSSSTYNSLPHIQDVSDAPKTHIQDLEDLRALLVKHKVPRDISIRSIHKHFDTFDDEVMVFQNVALPAYGTVQIMKPTESPNYQAYECGNHDLPNIKALEPFLGEFCQMVTKRGLQRMSGLKIKQRDVLDKGSWTGFEFHEKRSTMML